MTNLLFMGRKKVAGTCLRWLLDQPGVTVVGVLTDSHLDRSVTRDLAEQSGLPLYTLDTALRAIEKGALAFDLGVSMLYWRRLRDSFLSHPSRGIINFHPAPLPHYKGVGGYNLAILDKLSSWSATAHYVDATIDTGDIIAKADFPISPDNETAHSLEAKTQVYLEELFKTTVTAALKDSGRLPAVKNGAGRYLSRSELEAMKQIDINHDDIDTKVRAFWFPPYDGAYLEVEGQRFTLVSRSILTTLADPDASSLFSDSAPTKPHAKNGKEEQ